MALQALYAFREFQLLAFLLGKRLVFIKALTWQEDGNIFGSKVIVQIVEDKTEYPKPEFRPPPAGLRRGSWSIGFPLEERGLI